MIDKSGVLEPTPGRHFPPPASISPEAQAILELPLMPAFEFPAISDVEGWRTHVAEQDALLAGYLVVDETGFTVQPETIGGVPVYRAVSNKTGP